MNQYTTLDPNALEQAEVHRHLLSAVAPRPICFASTINTKGEVNLSPFSFFNVFSTHPPTLIFSPARRARDGSTKDSYNNAQQVPEVVINIVNHAIVQQMALSSHPYPKKVDEFKKSGLTPIQSKQVKPPRVGESPASFECKVEKIIPLGDRGGSGNLIFCRVVLIHIQNRYLDPQGYLDPYTLDLVGRLGKNTYVRATPEALFELESTGKALGMGVDQLPQSIRLSPVLTGNDLGRLGQLSKMPPIEEINKLLESEVIQKICRQGDLRSKRLKLHRLAQKILENNDPTEALRILMFADQL